MDTMTFSNLSRMTLPRWLTAAALVLGTAAAPLAHAQPDGMGRGGPGGHGMHAMKGPGGDMFGMGVFGHPRTAERAFDKIGATAEQRTQIAAIVAAARADLKAQREAGAGLRDQARQVFTAPTVDARAAETLRQQMLARHDQASRRTMQAMLDISRVLTPAQRAQLAVLAEQHRAAMRERWQGQGAGAAPGPR
jgi:Spy/CpxP family protein refolding chaperone